MKNYLRFFNFNENIIFNGADTWMCRATRVGELEGEYQGRFLGTTILQETGGKFKWISRIDITKNLLNEHDALRFLAHLPSLFFSFLLALKQPSESLQILLNRILPLGRHKHGAGAWRLRMASSKKMPQPGYAMLAVSTCQAVRSYLIKFGETQKTALKLCAYGWVL
jgi:hypothetical protein